MRLAGPGMKGVNDRADPLQAFFVMPWNRLVW